MVTASSRTQGARGGDVSGHIKEFSQAIKAGHREVIFGSDLL